MKTEKKIAIITPVYMAWDKVKMCCERIDKLTKNDFVHVLVDDSSPKKEELAGPNRVQLTYFDGLPPNEHRANITKALQAGYEYLLDNFDFEHLFIIESDVMVPEAWDQTMIDLAKLLPPHVALEAFAVDESGKPEYPMNVNPAIRDEMHKGMNFQVVDFCDFNCILINNDMLEDPDFHFDQVLSHHDILLCRYWKEKFPPRCCFRTTDVNVIHYPNSSRSMLPQGLSTPSN